VRYLLDCEYEIKVKEIDDLIVKKENKKIKNFIDLDATNELHQETDKIIEKPKKKTHTNFFKFNNKRRKHNHKKLEIKDEKLVKEYDRENDLFEEIYGKFCGDFNELVEEHTQLMLKFEINKKVDRTKVIFITMLSLFVGWLLSLTFLFI
jgi:hypothetical protein